MSTATPRPQALHSLPRLLPAGLRLGTAAAAVALVAGAWLAAGHASETALQGSTAALGLTVQHITLPPVTVVARREAPVAAAVASVARGGSAGATL